MIRTTLIDRLRRMKRQTRAKRQTHQYQSAAEALEARTLLTALTSGDTITGTIQAEGDVDTYTFQANAGDSAVINFSSFNSFSAFNARLRITDSSGAEVYNRVLDHHSVELTNLASDTYSVIIHDDNLTDSADYALTYVKTPGAHQLPGSEGALVSGVTRSGSLTPADIDVFTFDANAGETVDFNFASSNAFSAFSANIRITDAAGNEVYDRILDNHSIELTDLSAGTYTITIRDDSGGDTADYDFTYVRTPGAHTLPMGEGALVSGVSRTGALTPGDIDIFHFDASAGDTVDFNFASSNAFSAFSAKIRIIDPSGDEIYDRTLDFHSVELNGLADGTYTITIRDDSGGDTADYDLTYVRTPGTQTLPVDEGALVSGVTRSGALTPADIDVFSFDANAGDSVDFNFASSNALSAFSAKIRVVDPSGDEIYDRTLDHHAVELNSLADGTYTVTIRDDSGGDTADYDLTYVRIPSMHQLPAGEGALTSGVTKSGTLTPADIDVYTFAASNGDSIDFDFTSSNAFSAFSAKIRIFDPNGNEVYDRTLDDHHDQLSALVGGTYTITIRDDSGLDTADYELTVSGFSGFAAQAVYVNDDFTQADGTNIADADPNTFGNQAAVIGTTAFATIQQGVDAVADGGMVFVTDDIATDGVATYVENVVVAKSVIIEATDGASGAVVVDGGGVDSVFSTESGLISLKSLVIQNGAANDGGGIVNHGGVVRILNTSIEQNSADADGGGIWNSATGVVILADGSIVSGNIASGAADDQGGGGIFNAGGRLAILPGTTITGNDSAGSGGGIFSSNGVVTVDDSHVANNTASRAGGGIEFVTGVIELRNSQLSDNQALGGSASAPGNGGGLHVTGRLGQVGYIRVFGGTFSGNTAAGQGGGLWNEAGNVMVIRDGALIDDNTASGDAAEDGGGGIYNHNGRLAVGEASVISNNTADGTAGSGGGVFSTGSAVSFETGTILRGNSATGAGGGVEVINGLLHVIDTTIEDNSAHAGGGLHVRGTAATRVDLRNSIVRTNTADHAGGGLWHQTGSVMLVRIGTQVTGNTASGDAADEGGGGLFNNGGRLVIHAAAIEGNTAEGTNGSGGGLLLFHGVTTIENTTLSRNTAPRAGGGVEIVDGILATRNTDIVDNAAGGAAPHPGNGGGLHISGTNLTRVTIEGGRISNNTATGDGGGVWHQTGSLFVIKGGTTIAGNTASANGADHGGGGIFNNGGRVAIAAATISGNSADGSLGAGGGILSLGGGLTIDNSTISGNTAHGNGGGVVSHGELITANATIVLNRSDADGNSSGNGGGLHNGGLATISNTIVAGNLRGNGSSPNDIVGNALEVTSGHNLVGDAATAGGLMQGVQGNLIGNAGAGTVNLSTILSPVLTDNGGPTFTHTLAPGSPAIDSGNNNLAKFADGIPFTTDQRGPGFPRINNDTIDRGAVEA